MGRRLTHRDLRALSTSIRVLYQTCEVESFPRQVSAAITPLIACDYFAYNEFDGQGALTSVHAEPGLPSAATEFLLAIGPKFSQEHPTLSHIADTGTSEPLRITDFKTQRQWRQTMLYQEFFHPLECEYQIAFASPASDGQVALAFNCRGRDYTEEDRQVLELLRPHLMQARANAQLFTRMTSALQGTGGAFLSAAANGSIAYATGEALRLLERYFGRTAEAGLLPPRLSHWLMKPAASSQVGPLVIEQDEASLRITLAAREQDGTCNLLLEEKRDSVTKERLRRLGLTGREAEVLVWVARGKTSGEIAIILGSKPATVSKHLDHIYQKLGVENRTSAAAYVTGA